MYKYKVCVYCTAYNHEKYIRQTIDGFVNQKTDFDFCCIVHDDASTDGTAKIIREYEKLYPDLVFGIYQTDNQYSKGVNIIKKYIVPKIKSEYVAICEGDDFWNDELKLQKQVNALDNNKDCFMCTHKTMEIYENGDRTGTMYPKDDYPEGCLNMQKVLADGYSFHTSSYLFSFDKWIEYIQNPPIFRQICDVGDVPYLLYFGYIGKIYYIPDVMSCYRRGVPTSWSVSRANLQGDKFIVNLTNHALIMFNTYVEYNEFSKEKFNSICLEKCAKYFLQYNTLLKSNLAFFKYYNFKYFLKLSLKYRFFVLISGMFPNKMQQWYLKHLHQLNTKKMKI